jgi:hypothetical protein
MQPVLTEMDRDRPLPEPREPGAIVEDSPQVWGAGGQRATPVLRLLTILHTPCEAEMGRKQRGELAQHCLRLGIPKHILEAGMAKLRDGP